MQRRLILLFIVLEWSIWKKAGMEIYLTLQCVTSTKRSYIFNQNCSWKLLKYVIWNLTQNQSPCQVLFPMVIFELQCICQKHFAPASKMFTYKQIQTTITFHYVQKLRSIEASFGGTSIRSINTETNVFFSFTESIALFKKLFGTRLTVTVRLQS